MLLGDVHMLLVTVYLHITAGNMMQKLYIQKLPVDMHMIPVDMHMLVVNIHMLLVQALLAHN